MATDIISYTEGYFHVQTEGFHVQTEGFHVQTEGLWFQAKGFGVDRVLPPSQELKPLLSSDERVAFVHDLLKNYLRAILVLAKTLDIAVPERSSLEVCHWFSSYIKDKGIDRLEELSLKSQGLRDLPPQIGFFVGLKKLDLSNNNLAFLFPELTLFSELEELDVSGNVDIILLNLSRLPKLRLLNLTGCGFEEAPPWTRECPNLEVVLD